MKALDTRDSAAIAFGDALIALLAEKDIDRITVTELAKRAGYSRKTFYARYSNVMDVMDELVQTMRENTGSIADLPAFATDPSVIPTYLRSALGKAGTGPQSVKLMRYDLIVFDFYNRMLAESLLEEWERLYPFKRDRLGMYADAVVAGVCSICHNWAKMKRPLPIDELCDFLEFYLEGVFGALQGAPREGVDAKGLYGEPPRPDVPARWQVAELRGCAIGILC